MILKSMIYLELENWISSLLDAVYIYNLLFKEDTREMRRQSRDCEILQIRDVIFASVDILMSAPVMQSSYVTHPRHSSPLLSCAACSQIFILPRITANIYHYCQDLNTCEEEKQSPLDTMIGFITKPLLRMIT